MKNGSGRSTTTATLAGIGAFYLTFLMTSVPLWAAWQQRIYVTQGPPQFELALLPAGFIGVFIATRVGQWRAAVSTVAWATLFYPLMSLAKENLYLWQCHNIATVAPTISCPANGSGTILLLHWPLLVGITLGALVVRSAGALEVPATLQAAGWYAVLVGFVQPALAAFYGLPNPGAGIVWLDAATLLLHLFGAVGAAITLRRHSGQSVRSAVLLALVLLIGWIRVAPDVLTSLSRISLSLAASAAPAVAALLIVALTLVPIRMRSPGREDAPSG